MTTKALFPQPVQPMCCSVIAKIKTTQEACATFMSESPTTQQKLTAASGDAGRRLDLFLAQRIPVLSRTRIQELIREGNVRVDGRTVIVAHRVAAGEAIEIEVVPRP